MNNQSFSKIWIIVIVLALLAGGILAWWHFGARKEKVVEKPEEVAENQLLKKGG